MYANQFWIFILRDVKNVYIYIFTHISYMFENLFHLGQIIHINLDNIVQYRALYSNNYLFNISNQAILYFRVETKTIFDVANR